MRRVVVTGIGAVTPLACGAEETWTRLLNGESGAAHIQKFDTSDLAVSYACEIKPKTDDRPDGFDAAEWVAPKEQRKIDDFMIYGLAAAQQALADSGYTAETEEQQFRTGVLTGSGIGGLPGMAEGALILENKGPRRIGPFFIPGRLINLLSGHISINNGFKGPNHSPVTACATGNHAIGDASRLIMYGDADVMVAGGGGTIVNIGGVSAHIGAKERAHVAAAKAGIAALTLNQAAELARYGIRSAGIAPGFIASAMTDELNEKQRETILTTIPSGRLGTADEVAAGAVFLASDEASYITGQTMHINGGMAMI